LTIGDEVLTFSKELVDDKDSPKKSTGSSPRVQGFRDSSEKRLKYLGG
jgi:hypothetical protein